MCIGRMLGETWIILGARSWRLHNLVEDLDEEIGALMGELLVVILLLDHDLDPETCDLTVLCLLER